MTNSFLRQDGEFAVLTTADLPPSATQYINVKDPAYGATGNGTTDDTAAIQAAINAAQSQPKGGVFIPSGTYLVSATLNVSSGITIQGQGYSSVYESTLRGSIIKSTVNSSTILNILTDDSVFLYGFGINNVGTGACIGINLDTDNSTSLKLNVGSIISGVAIYGNAVTAGAGIQSLNCANQCWQNNSIWNCYSGMIVGCNNSPGNGDNSIEGNTISGSDHGLTITTSGGVRFVNNKINGNPSHASIGVYVSAAAISALSCSPIIISSNSIEGVNTGILLQRFGSNTMKANNIVITGNEIVAGFSTAGANWCVLAQTSGGDASRWITGMVISGNFLFVGNGGAGMAHASIDGATDVLLGSNVCETNGTATALGVGGNTLNVIQSGNCKGAGVT